MDRKKGNALEILSVCLCCFHHLNPMETKIFLSSLRVAIVFAALSAAFWIYPAESLSAVHTGIAARIRRACPPGDDSLVRNSLSSRFFATSKKGVDNARSSRFGFIPYLSLRALSNDGELSANHGRASASRAITNGLEFAYVRCSTIKCPFFKRRASDVVDSIATVLNFLAARHKSLWWDLPEEWFDGEIEVPGCRAGSTEKATGFPLENVALAVMADWVGEEPGSLGLLSGKMNTERGIGDEENNVQLLQVPCSLGSKGYYITGRLNRAYYRNDCIFNGPDPDMPVRGLRKYLAAASRLFDPGRSTADLTSIGIDRRRNVIIVTWRLGGVLMLPWRPKVPSYTGRTTYYVDGDGLICQHEEDWDISVLEAFIRTIRPGLGNLIWGVKSHVSDAERENHLNFQKKSGR
mmetsp:Transcript_40293/g.94684  ORF Transcript_40293/g.94684 Transcript_40293/m.94684 type:complete len:408 (-) Transcript_40293:287-1510(-)